MEKWTLIIILIAFIVAFMFAFTTLVLEKVIWLVADKVSNGVLSAQGAFIRYKMRNFGQYIYELQILLGENGKPITNMTWEEFRIEYGRKIALELKIARQVNKMLGSYLSTVEEK